MKGSTSLRRFCWLHVNFNYGHEVAVLVVVLNCRNVPLCTSTHKGTYAQCTVMSSVLRGEATFMGKPARFMA